MRQIPLIILAVALGVAASAGSAHAEDLRDAIEAPIVAPTSDGRLVRGPSAYSVCFPREDAAGWRFEFTGALWTAGARGDNTVAARRHMVDSSPIDAVQALTDHGDAFILGRARVYYDRWGLRIEGASARLSRGFDFREGITQPIAAEIGVDMIQADLAFRIGRHTVGGSRDCPSTLTYEVFGGRYLKLLGSIARRGALPRAAASEETIDPYVGARVILDINNRWSFDFEVDVGGFGVGTDQSFGLRGGFRYRAARWLSAEVGYKLLDVEYLAGAGATIFSWDILLHGPYIGLTLHL